MTEFEWLTTDDWLALWWQLRSPEQLTERRMRLFAVAACRRIADRMIQPGSLLALEVAEKYADGVAGEGQRAAAHARSREGRYEDFPPTLPAVPWAATRAASWLCHEEVWKSIRAVEEAPAVDGYEAVIAAGLLDPSEPPDVNAVSRHAGIRNGAITPDWGLIWQHEVFRQGEQTAAAMQAALLRDIFGSPFRPVSFSPEWRTDTAVSLACTMYDSREFGAMPILADAIQDAGCDDGQILSHCRDTSLTHVRGCWVVDLVLGKQ